MLAEVLPDHSPLYELPNVFLTPHIAGSLGQETQRLADCIVDEVERFCKGAALKHIVRRQKCCIAGLKWQCDASSVVVAVVVLVTSRFQLTLLASISCKKGSRVHKSSSAST